MHLKSTSHKESLLTKNTHMKYKKIYRYLQKLWPMFKVCCTHIDQKYYVSDLWYWGHENSRFSKSSYFLKHWDFGTYPLSSIEGPGEKQTIKQPTLLAYTKYGCRWKLRRKDTSAWAIIRKKHTCICDEYQNLMCWPKWLFGPFHLEESGSTWN